MIKESETMEKIIILNYHMACGGTEKAMLGFINSLDYSKYKVVLYLMYREGPLLEKIPQQVEIKTIDFDNEKARFFASVKVKNKGIKVYAWKIYRKLLRAFKGDGKALSGMYDKVVKSHVISEDSCDYLCDFSGYGHFQSVFGATKINARKKTMWIHDERMDWLERVEKYLPCYDAFFCVSKAVKVAFDKKYPMYKDKSYVMYNYIDVEGIRKSAEIESEARMMTGDNKLLTVGRIVDQKGYDIAIQIAEILRKRNVDFKWYFVGDGLKFNKMKEMIQAKQLQDRIILLGAKDNPYPYFAKCDIYVQPSRHEGYGLVLAEAKILGKVSVSSDLNSFREQIESGKNGYICELNPRNFADTIEMLINNKEKCREIEERLKKTEMDFSKEINVFYDVIEKK